MPKAKLVGQISTLVLPGNSDASLVGLVKLNFDCTAGEGVIQIGDEQVPLKVTLSKESGLINFADKTVHVKGHARMGGTVIMGDQRGNLYFNPNWGSWTARLTFVPYVEGFDAASVLASVNASYESYRNKSAGGKSPRIVRTVR